MGPSVTIRLRPDDAAVVANAMRRISVSTSAVAITLLGAVIGGGIGTMIDSATGQSWVASPWLTGALCGAVLLLWIGARRYETGMPNPSLSPEPMVVTVTDRGVHIEHRDFNAHHAWTGLAGVEEQRDHIVVKTHASGMFVFPRRDFLSTDHMGQFVQSLRTGIDGTGR